MALTIRLEHVQAELGVQASGKVLIFTDQRSGIRVEVPISDEASSQLGAAMAGGVALPNGRERLDVIRSKR